MSCGEPDAWPSESASWRRALARGGCLDGELAAPEAKLAQLADELDEWCPLNLDAHLNGDVGVEMSDASTMGDSAMESWLAEWHERVQRWWLATPYQEGLDACFGSLSLHLVSRLELFLKERFGRSGTGSPSLKSQAETQRPIGSEGDCETLLGDTKLGIPDFPQMPSQWEFGDSPVFPIPRLLPRLLPRLAPEPWAAAPAGSAARGLVGGFAAAVSMSICLLTVRARFKARRGGRSVQSGLRLRKQGGGSAAAV